MRVIYDTTIPSLLQTGTAVYSHQLANALECIPSVEVIRLNAGASLTTASGLGKLKKWAAITAWMQASLPLQIRKRRGDILHEPSFLGPVCSPCPLVVVIHDVICDRYPQYYPVPWRLYLAAIVPAVARRAARVITASESAKQDIAARYHIPTSRIQTIPHGVDAQYRQMDSTRAKDYIREKYAIGVSYLLFVGAQEHRKNVPRLLRAYGLLSTSLKSSHEIVLAGPRGRGTEQILRTIQDLGLSDRVRFLGYVPTEDLPALYNSASVLVFPSLYEGFGLPPLEAMACGTPVIASKTSSIPEVTDGAAVLVDPLDATGLSTAMKRVLLDEDLRREMIARGLERAADFTWRRAAMDTVAVYRAVEGGA